MYEHFNPFDPDDAGWQYALMLLGALVLGYVIGLLSRRRQVAALEEEWNELEVAIDECQAQVPSTADSADLASALPETHLPTEVPPVPSQVPMDNAFLTTAVLTESQPEDLTIIEGIGPAIAGLLHEAGINTFAALSETTADELTGLLRAAGPAYRIHDPRTWPEQARLAAEGEWEELKTYQESLDAGRASAGRT